MNSKNKKATVSDISKLAGVSAATVSRVLSSSNYPVRQELRDKVLEVARELNYRPNVLSRMLRGGESKEIGIIAPSITNPFYAQLISAAERECMNRGYLPFICSSLGDAELELRHLDTLEERQVAGIILSSINSGEGFLKKLAEIRTPLMLFDQTFDGFSGDCIRFDFFKGGYLSTEHLIRSGHRDIVFASGPLDRGSRRLMYEGYKQALRDNGMRSGKRKLLTPQPQSDASDESDYQLGQALGDLLLEGEYLPDAIVTINDMTAIGLINNLQKAGIQVPHDLSVMGFDDISISAMVTPPLSTIHQPTQDTGRLAAKNLLDKIEHQTSEPVQMMLQPILVERSSVRKIHKKIRRP